MLQYSADFERQYEFTQIGVLTTEQAVLAVSGRDNATVEALTSTGRVIWKPDEGTVAAIIRFRLDSNAIADDQFAIHIYAAKGADYYSRIGTVTCDCGTQDWSSGHFVDVLTLSNEKWAAGIRVISTVDEVGFILLNTGGFDRFVFVSPDFLDDDVDEVHIDIARLDKKIGGEFDDVVKELQDIETDTEAVKTAVDTVNTNLGTLETDVETVNTNLGTLEDDVEALFGSASLIRQSTTGGTQKLTISSNVAQGSSQACRSALVVHASDNAVYMNIGATADADDFIVPKNIIVPVPIDDCSDLYFYGTDADTIRILWRN